MRKTIGLITVLLVLSGLLSCKTQKQNVYLEETPVRVTELHFEPSDEQGDVEFIEIANVTRAPVDMDGGNAAAPRSNEESADIYLYAGSIRN